MLDGVDPLYGKRTELRRKLRRLLPGPSDVQFFGPRRLFGSRLKNPNLWHLNRHSVALAVASGLFAAFVPVPAQMLLAAGLAIVLGCNLPISVVMVWVSNPITMPPLFFAAYKLGAWLLGFPPRKIQFEMSVHWLVNKLGGIWEPFLLGCLVLGLVSAAIGYLTVQVIWRIHVIQSWRERRRRRIESIPRGTPTPTTANLMSRQEKSES